MAVLVCVGSAVMAWVMGNVKLLLEWLTIPLFIIALQLPQGAALYWLVSSLAALAQVLLPLPPSSVTLLLLHGVYDIPPCLAN